MTLAFVSYPGLPWIMREAFVEPPIVLAFFGGLWALICGRYLWPVVGAVVFLSIKQYTPLLLMPFWALGFSLRQTALAVAVVGAIALPFLVWSPSDFLWDTLTFLLHLPSRSDATSFNGWLFDRYNSSLPSWLVVGPPLLGAGYALWCLWRGADWRVVLRLTAGTYCVLFLFNKFAFANYYFLLQAMLLASGGVSLPRSPSPVEPAR
jgi:hypothetical protein